LVGLRSKLNGAQRVDTAVCGAFALQVPQRPDDPGAAEVDALVPGYRWGAAIVVERMDGSMALWQSRLLHIPNDGLYRLPYQLGVPAIGAQGLVPVGFKQHK
jgi:hypothetical protein